MMPSFASTDVLESLGYGYFELDLAGFLIYGNKIFYNSLGYTKDELLGRHFRRYMDREQVALVFNIFAMIHKTGMVEKKLPLDFTHKDGSQRTGEGSIALIRDENGTPIGFRGILLDITERKQKETTIIMADVCDKGVGAAMYMAIFRSLLRAYSDQQYIIRWSGVPVSAGNEVESPTGIFRRDAILASGAPSLKNAIDLTNNYIATQHGNSNMFATVFFGLLDPVDGTLLYINAGHEAPFLISEGRLKQRLDPTGPALGMLPDREFKLERTTLNPGDTLVLYTDGVTDARNAKDELFSEERLIATAVKSSRSAHAHLENIVAEVDAHTAGREQYDDITLLAVQRKENP